MSLIIFILILLVLVLVHEAGHFFTAKKFGIRVDEFGFGFPPKLLSRKYGETEYSLNLLPFGGFVKIFGENPDDENTNGPDKSRSFVHKPKWQQVLVLIAGVAANFMLAWFLFSIGLMSGLPSSVGQLPDKYLSNVNLVVVTVLADSPAEKSGLKSGDKIVSVKAIDQNGHADELTEINPDNLKEFIVSRPGKEIEMGYIRGKVTEAVTTTKLTPEKKNGAPAIGISMDQIGTAKLPFFKAIIEGASLTWFVTKGTVLGLYSLIVGAFQGTGSFDEVTGPVGMVGIVGEATKFGLAYLLSFAALISINLGVINLLPFPALDGGRVFFIIIEKIKGSRIKPNVANTANLVGFALLIILMLVVTFKDVMKLI